MTDDKKRQLMADTINAFSGCTIREAMEFAICMVVNIWKINIKDKSENIDYLCRYVDEHIRSAAEAIIEESKEDESI